MLKIKIERVRILNRKIERLKMLENEKRLKNLKCPNCMGGSISVYFREEDGVVHYVPYCTECHYSLDDNILLFEKIQKRE
ncbi:MAG: hypothetical protein KIH08_09735 [Candidatus Freyarchaeota archaeon]|nr:hypothetical protein [Candidatus Jordarchaeia archaeon]MBS7268693.1 hypothetical protein [Candidatus Jordarchaeia archaeon]MBS7279757.1 hypothetical protein [Candidatus Jordarchaeia archaeon]